MATNFFDKPYRPIFDSFQFRVPPDLSACPLPSRSVSNFIRYQPKRSTDLLLWLLDDQSLDTQDSLGLRKHQRLTLKTSPT